MPSGPLKNASTGNNAGPIPSPQEVTGLISTFEGPVYQSTALPGFPNLFWVADSLPQLRTFPFPLPNVRFSGRDFNARGK